MPVLIAIYKRTTNGFGHLLSLPWEGEQWLPAETDLNTIGTDYGELSFDGQYITYGHSVNILAGGNMLSLCIAVKIPATMVAVDIDDKIVSPYNIACQVGTIITNKAGVVDASDFKALLCGYRLRPRLGSVVTMTGEATAIAYVADNGLQSRAELIDALALCPRICGYGRILIGIFGNSVPLFELNAVDMARITPISIVFPRRDNAPIYRRINGYESHKYCSCDFDFPSEGFHNVEIELNRQKIESYLAESLNTILPEGVTLEINAPLAEVKVIFNPHPREKIITVRVDGINHGDTPASLLAALEYYKLPLARGELILSGYALVHFESMRRAYPDRIEREVHFKTANPHYRVAGVDVNGDMMLVHLAPHATAANIRGNVNESESYISSGSMTRLHVAIPSRRFGFLRRNKMAVTVEQSGSLYHTVVSHFPEALFTTANGIDEAELYIPLMAGADIRVSIGAPTKWYVVAEESSGVTGSYEAIAGDGSRIPLWERARALFRYRHSQDISTPLYLGRFIAEALLWVAALLIGVTVGVIYHAEIAAL